MCTTIISRIACLKKLPGKSLQLFSGLIFFLVGCKSDKQGVIPEVANEIRSMNQNFLVTTPSVVDFVTSSQPGLPIMVIL
jgi:hypothetical protein